MNTSKVHPYSKITLLITILLTSFITFAQTPGGASNDGYISRELSSRLLAVAEEAINTQYQILVSGDLEGSFKNKKSAHLYREAMMNQFTAQLYRRGKLKETKQDYKDFKTKLTVKFASKEGDKITLNITERTRLKLDAPGGPEATEFIEDHLFEFTYEKQQWKLIKDTILRPEPSPIQDINQPLPNNLRMTPLTDAPPGHQAHKFQVNQMDIKSFDVPLVKALFTSSLPQSGYDRVAATAYARAHALSYNLQYYRFRNDCTNFASQCMYTGGWQMVGFGVGYGRANPANWYYSCFSSFGQPIATYSWGAAYNFNVFILNANRVEGVQFYQDLDEGDLIFADWDSLDGTHHPDGRVDHVMIVTGKDTEGNVYVSYHTNDRLDRPMTDIRIAEPNANFFGDRVR